jgi:hypothetical protein
MTIDYRVLIATISARWHFLIQCRSGEGKNIEDLKSLATMAKKNIVMLSRRTEKNIKKSRAKRMSQVSQLCLHLFCYRVGDSNFFIENEHKLLQIPEPVRIFRPNSHQNHESRRHKSHAIILPKTRNKESGSMPLPRHFSSGIRRNPLG